MTFKAAPIGRRIRKTTGLLALLLLAAMFLLPHFMRPHRSEFFLNFQGVAAFLCYALFFFCVWLVRNRSYEWRDGILTIDRGLWRSNVAIGEVQEAVEGEAMLRKSIKLIGNSGIFAVAGRFRVLGVGTVRTYVSNHEKCVFLSGTKGKAFVSPENPEAFMAEVTRNLAP